MIPMFLGGFVLLLLFVFGTQALLEYGKVEDNYDLRRAKERTEIRDRVLAEAATALNEYAWIDQEKGLVQLPVNRAMELTVEALALNNPIEPAGYIDPLKALAEQQSGSPTPPETPATPGSEASPAPDASEAAQATPTPADAVAPTETPVTP